MEINLHNKFEISIGEKNIVAYNTLLDGVYNKISKLEQYTSHIAIGTGQTRPASGQNKLTTFLRSFKAETEEINCDPSKSPLFIKKLVTIDEESPDEFSFCELGLCSSDQFDAEIYNHVLLTDQDGNVVNVERKQGDALQIRVTIYLELTNSSEALFTLGNNKLIGRILGDDSAVSDENLYALKGEILTENIPLKRPPVNMENAAICSSSLTKTEGGAKITFSAELGEGATEEIVVVYDGQVVLRLNTLEVNDPEFKGGEFNGKPGCLIELGEGVKSVQNVEKDGKVETSYVAEKYATKLIDKLDYPFDIKFNDKTQRFVSSDGKMIAFIAENQVHLYRLENYEFKKLNTTQLRPSNLFRMFILKSNIILLQTTSPYIRIFDIEDDAVIERQVSLSEYNASILSYAWLDAEATISSQTIILGLIISETNTPVVVRFTKSLTNVYYDHITRPQIETALRVFAIHENPYFTPTIGFMTNRYSGSELYLIEEFYENSSKFGRESQKVYNILNDSTMIKTAGRAIVSQKPLYPFFVTYFYPDFEYGGDEVSRGVMHYPSKDGKYVVVKNADGSFLVKNFHVIGQLTDFENSLDAYVNPSDITDIEFVDNILLIFTSSSIVAVALKDSQTMVENLSSADGVYSVSYTKYDLPGSKPMEGVKLNLTFDFSGQPSSISLSAKNNRLTTLSSYSQLSEVNIK